jgi:hypothetical protein
MHVAVVREGGRRRFRFAVGVQDHHPSVQLSEAPVEISTCPWQCLVGRTRGLVGGHAEDDAPGGVPIPDVLHSTVMLASVDRRGSVVHHMALIAQFR